MKFKKGTRRRALEYEKDLVQIWKEDKTFEKSLNDRPKSNAYVFYDGPPFITGSPHHGTLLSSIVKDAVPRYWTMKGKHVERVWGWDCHGLPAEVFTEKKLGIKGKPEVIDYGLEKYIIACRENMVATGGLWEDTIDRIGRWVDFKGAYKTMDKNYMESVWWAFKALYDKGKIYEGEKILMYCTQDATPLSKAEVTMDSGTYQDVTDPSVYVKFKLAGTNEYLLAWTTTPWTLSANTALAINSEVTYCLVEIDGQNLIIAKDLVAKVLTDEKHKPLNYKLAKYIKGKDLVGKSYEPLFGNHGKNAHKIWHADYVSTSDGTGIVHIAPAFGEEDYALAKQNGIPLVNTIDDNGNYIEGEYISQNVWEINKQIAKDLHAQEIVWKIEYVRHSYPHCYRCGTKLMYRAWPSWFFDIDSQRQQMLEQNSNINWFPDHLKNGRFAKTIQAAPDWNLSRDRFWATAMPVWKGVDKEGKERIKVVGSYAELKDLSGVELEDYHRPWVDDIKFTLDGVEYQRIDKVLDCWFESGSMPFAQFHYPFENVEKFEANFPGDFIVEYVGQVRAWFYYVHAVSVGLFGKNAYNNVITTGTLLGADGRKLSKSLNNFTDPNILMDQYSADSLRYFMLSSPVLNGEDVTLLDKEVGDIARKLGMVWNMYDFFTLYADVDGWGWDGKLEDPSPTLNNILDIWIISRLHQLIADVDEHMQKYDLPNAIKPIIPFIEDASNWYVRRSRKRFWKSDNDADKDDAYKTLHYVLAQLSLVLAPFTPFLSDELYKKLTDKKSVHLQNWPKSGHVEELIIAQMAITRELITDGLSQRAAAAIKVRQPLSTATICFGISVSEKEQKELCEILREELNVKEVEVKIDNKPYIELDLKITEDLKLEGLAREVIRAVQNARKQAGLEVDDRISLNIVTQDPELARAVAKYQDIIELETLAKYTKVEDGYSIEVKIDNKKADINIIKNK